MKGMPSGPQILLPLLVIGAIGFYVFRNSTSLRASMLKTLKVLGLAFGFYVLVVLFGNFDEMRRWRNVSGLLFLTDGAPVTIWTITGGGGALGIIAYSLLRRRRSSLIYDDSVTVESGQNLISHGEAVRRGFELIGEEQHPLFWGMVTIPQSEANKHFCIMGATGSGKTTHLKLLMRNSIAFAGCTFPGHEKKGDRRAVVYDSKRNMVGFLTTLCSFAPVYTLDPFDVSGVAWDIAADVTDPALALEIATILVPEEKQSSSPYFGDATRTLLAGLIKAYIRKAPGKWTLRDVMLAIRNPVRLKKILSLHSSTGDCLQFFEDEKHFPAVLTTILTKTNRYDVVAALWEHAPRRISLNKDWRDTQSILVLAQDDKHRAALDCINQLLFKFLSQISLAMPDKKDRQTWFFLDEIREAPRFDGIESLLNRGREKGVCVAIGFQNMSGLRERYGDNLATELPGMCSNKTFLRTDDSNTAQWVEEHYGKARYLERKTSQTQGRSYSDGKVDENESNTVNTERTDRPVILGSNLQKIPQTTDSITSYNDIPIIGAFKATVGFDDINKMMAPITQNLPPHAPTFKPRNASMQELEEWNLEDLKRLGLDKWPELLGPNTERPQVQKSPPPPDTNEGGDDDDLFNRMPKRKK